MIDYILANLPHEPGCCWHPLYSGCMNGKTCTCRRAEAERWLRDRVEFLQLFGEWLDRDVVEPEDLEQVMTAFARLEVSRWTP